MSSLLILLLTIVIIVVFRFYRYVTRTLQYWRNRNIDQLSVRDVLWEHLNLFFHFQPFCYQVQQAYSKFSDKRIYGSYQFTQKSLFVRDPELIKLITVKDFDHFLNHTDILPDNIDPLWNQNLFVLKDKKWREMRSVLSPVFTSSKIKQMFVLIMNNAQQFTNYFKKFHNNTVTVDIKDVFTRYANDVIYNIAFGIECDSLDNKNNEFYLNGKEATSIMSLKKIVQITILMTSPSLAKFLGIRIYPKQAGEFFVNLIRDNIRKREELDIKRPDLVNILMEAKNRQQNSDNVDDNKIEWNDFNITAQALIFFFAGFDSTSILMSFMAYELAVNPDIQQKLYSEIIKIVDGDNIDYDHLTTMKYMEMVMMETLRKWPINIATDRVCTKPYRLQLDDQQSVLIEKDTVVYIPIYPIHYDPKYYPEPERFDPERFNDQNKPNLTPYTFLTFGAGPRNCIGNRLALLETKILFFNLLQHFEIVAVDKTEVPLKISRMSFNIYAQNGIWLGFKKRENS